MAAVGARGSIEQLFGRTDGDSHAGMSSCVAAAGCP